MPDGETTIQKPKGCPNSAADYSMLYRYTVAKRKIANGEAYESIVAQPGGRELWAKLESHRNWDENYHNIMLEYPQLFELGDADNAALKRMSKYASYLAAANSRDSDIPHPDDVEEDYHKYQNIRDDNREELQKQYEDAQEKFKKENAKKYGPRARMFGWGVAIAATLGLVGAIAAAAIGGLVSAVTIPSLGFGFMQGAGLAITAGIVFLVKPIASGIVKLFKKCFDKFGKANADRVAAKTERKKAKAELSTAQESYKAVQRQIAADLATERYSRMPGSRMSEQAITSFNPGAELDAEFERNYLSASERYADANRDITSAAIRRSAVPQMAVNATSEYLASTQNIEHYISNLANTIGLENYYIDTEQQSLEKKIEKIIMANPGITEQKIYDDLQSEYKSAVNSGTYSLPISPDEREYIDSVKSKLDAEELKEIMESPNVKKPLDICIFEYQVGEQDEEVAAADLKRLANREKARRIAREAGEENEDDAAAEVAAAKAKEPSIELENGLVRGRLADSYIDDVFAKIQENNLGIKAARGSAIMKSAFSRGLDNLSQSEHFTEGEKTTILEAYDEYLDSLKKSQADESEDSFDSQTFNEEDFVLTPDSVKNQSYIDEDYSIQQADIIDRSFEAKQDDITYANEVAHKSLDDEIDKRVSEGQNFEQVAEWIVEETNKAKQLEADEQKAQAVAENKEENIAAKNRGTEHGSVPPKYTNFAGFTGENEMISHDKEMSILDRVKKDVNDATASFGWKILKGSETLTSAKLTEEATKTSYSDVVKRLIDSAFERIATQNGQAYLNLTDKDAKKLNEAELLYRQNPNAAIKNDPGFIGTYNPKKNAQNKSNNAVDKGLEMVEIILGKDLKDVKENDLFDEEIIRIQLARGADPRQIAKDIRDNYDATKLR